MRKRFSPLLLLIPATMALTQGQADMPTAKDTLSHPATQASCPWLNHGTATGALGEDVTTMAHISDSGEGSCKFSRQQGSTDSLEIEVSHATLPDCPQASKKLAGIGNEAKWCRLPAATGRLMEMISGRVRDWNFTITWRPGAQKGSSAAYDKTETILDQLAEQVAGNLF